MIMLNKRTMLVRKIKAEVDIERLTDLLANDFLIQEAAGELEETIKQAERKE